MIWSFPHDLKKSLNDLLSNLTLAVSQTFACEEINNNRMNVVGWYHSHPTFNPNPSIRDIETQLKFQVYPCQLKVIDLFIQSVKYDKDT